MDCRGNIYTEAELLKMKDENKEGLSRLGKLIEVFKEDNIQDMNTEDRRKWYARMVNSRSEFPKPK